MTRILAAVAFVCVALCLISPAFADQAAAAVPAALGSWPALAAAGLVLAGYLVRLASPASHFLHTPLGSAAITLATSVLSGLAKALAENSLNRNALIQAVVTAVLQLVANSNPSMMAEDREVKSKLQLLPLLFLFGMAASSCTYCAQPANAGTARCIAQVVSIDCGIPAVANAAVAALPAIEARINGKTIDWKALGNEELQVGIPTVACAIQMSEKLASSSASPEDSPRLIASGLLVDALEHREEIQQNASDYYAARRIQFKAPVAL